MRGAGFGVVAVAFLAVAVPQVVGSGLAAAQPAEGKEAGRPEADRRLRLPTWGVSLVPPEGWTEQVRDKPKTIARWALPGGRPNEVKAMIMVEDGVPQKAGATAAEAVEGLAKAWGGIVSDTPTTLDGVPAVRVTAPPRSPRLSPVEAIAALHRGRIYLIMGGVAGGASCAAEVEALRSSWKWIDVEPPAKSLELVEPSGRLLNGAVTMKVPRFAYWDLTLDRSEAEMLCLYNPVNGKSDFSVYIGLVPNPAATKMEDFRTGLADGLFSRMKLSAKPAWRNFKGDPDRCISDTVVTELADGKPVKRVQGRMRWSLIRLDAKRVVMINFQTWSTVEKSGPSSRPSARGFWRP
jgi:hypothetical protein